MNSERDAEISRQTPWLGHDSPSSNCQVSTLLRWHCGCKGQASAWCYIACTDEWWRTASESWQIPKRGRDSYIRLTANYWQVALSLCKMEMKGWAATVCCPVENTNTAPCFPFSTYLNKHELCTRLRGLVTLMVSSPCVCVRVKSLLARPLVVLILTANKVALNVLYVLVSQGLCVFCSTCFDCSFKSRVPGFSFLLCACLQVDCPCVWFLLCFCFYQL